MGRKTAKNQLGNSKLVVKIRILIHQALSQYHFMFVSVPCIIYIYIYSNAVKRTFTKFREYIDIELEH